MKNVQNQIISANTPSLKKKMTEIMRKKSQIPYHFN